MRGWLVGVRCSPWGTVGESFFRVRPVAGWGCCPYKGVGFRTRIFQFKPVNVFAGLTVGSIFSLSLLQVLMGLWFRLKGRYRRVIRSIQLSAFMFLPCFVTKRRVSLSECTVFDQLRLTSSWVGVNISSQGTYRMFLRVSARRLQVNEYRTFIQLMINGRESLLTRHIRRIQDARLSNVRIRGGKLRRATTSQFSRTPPILRQDTCRHVE